ncbi:sodium calcium transporter [Fusarium sp. NRRL 52700]|nr:sodium calcium transporter [Fusarium sp. NRRL 52700]
MVNGDAIPYNVAVFISTLFLLEFGADKFVDHTAIVARRTGIPDTVIALLTAGAEWEELVVVVASLAQGRPSLAVGNIIGSAISNILGAFSLGLLFRPTGSHVEFDRSSRIYSLCLLVITTFVVPIIYFSQRIIWLVCGSVLIALFAMYLISIGWAISRGSLTAPEGSDDVSSSDESDTSSIESRPSVRSPLLPNREEREPGDNERDQRVDGSPAVAGVVNASSCRRRRNLGYHIGFLVLGFLAICLSGYVLSHAAINVTDAIGISDVLFGIVILAVATTLPEKFVAVLSGNRGHVGILVANTVGSNVFLLSLCLGIVMVDTSGNFDGGNINVPELCVLWVSTAALTVTVCSNSPTPKRRRTKLTTSATSLYKGATSTGQKNKDDHSQTDSWGHGAAGRPKNTTKKDTYTYETVGGNGSDGVYHSRNPYGQRSRRTTDRQLTASYPTEGTCKTCLLCPITTFDAKEDVFIPYTHQAFCKHQQARAQQDRYGHQPTSQKMPYWQELTKQEGTYDQPGVAWQQTEGYDLELADQCGFPQQPVEEPREGIVYC